MERAGWRGKAGSYLYLRALRTAEDPFRMMGPQERIERARPVIMCEVREGGK